MRKTTPTRANSSTVPAARVDAPYAGRRAMDREASEEFFDKLAWLMDRAIPLGRRFGIGLDAVLGLIPGLGDVAGGLISSFLILHAHQAGIPKATLLRMVANVGIDTLLGAIPFVGDLFDIAWQANVRNVELYRGALKGTRDTRRDWGFLMVLLVALAALVSLPVLLAIWVLRAVL